MSLKAMLASMKNGKILIPTLRDKIARQEQAVADGLESKKDAVIEDANLAIEAFRERIDEFNHGEEIKGEFFHPSALGGCLRRTWLKHFDAPQDSKASKSDSLKNWLRFEIGSYFHVLFSNLMVRAGIVVKREVAIMDAENRILGHCDVVVKINNTKYAVEIKTINSRGFTSLGKEPQQDHKIQVHCYMHSLKLNWAIIVYYDKDRSELKEFVIQYDPAFYEKYCASRIDAYFRHVRTKTIPFREEGKNCQYCPYTWCFQNDKVKDFLSTLNSKKSFKVRKKKK